MEHTAVNGSVQATSKGLHKNLCANLLTLVWMGPNLCVFIQHYYLGSIDRKDASPGTKQPRVPVSGFVQSRLTQMSRRLFRSCARTQRALGILPERSDPASRKWGTKATALLSTKDLITQTQCWSSVYNFGGFCLGRAGGSGAPCMSHPAVVVVAPGPVFRRHEHGRCVAQALVQFVIVLWEANVSRVVALLGIIHTGSNARRDAKKWNQVPF